MKKWFEDSIQFNTNLRTAQFQRKKEILWDFVGGLDSSGAKVNVLVPIIYRDQLVTSIEVGGKHESVDLTTYSRSYLLLTEDKAKKNARIINYIADKDYFLNNDQTNIVGPTFSGRIYVKDWDETFLYGRILKNGNVVSHLSPGNGQINNGRTSSGCWEISSAVYSQGCVPAINYCSELTFLYWRSEIICDRFDGNPDAVDWSQMPNALPGGCCGSDPAIVYAYVLNDDLVREWLKGANDYEKAYYTRHPWLIYAAMRAQKTAESKTLSLYGNEYDNTIANAFKHAFWVGLMVLTWDDGIARFLAELHEADITDPQNLAKKMDLQNNELGNKIGLFIKSKYSDPKDQETELRILIKDEIDMGRGVYIKDGVLTPTNR
ncbi:hypothetical protein MUK70_10575 [Dyadobacter chenwenxiniae]|uniref:DUF6973 domain-containing protein n=1 Tax=Dyadobacter chenwenxiniae TaxID=2906456 RepID=A0A9X1TG05_9BACT|nr:hypothetical protein [Dyadobacter chenwenxiniae]MCF0063190.1 hypothetical protein [Dyadobacter chenwenxiniae]UON85430.1 hypothetical protein MUK70_10575 [Dyadobacter chenwenxiniae]